MAKFTQKQISDLQTQIDPNKHTQETFQPTEEQRLRDRNFMSDLTLAINFRSDYDEKWKECVARYKAEPFYYEDGRAGVVLPVGKFIIETAQAQESKAPPTFSYAASQFKEDIKKAEILEYVIKKHVWYVKEVDLDYKLDVLNQDKMVLGTMYQYVGYRKMYRPVRTFTNTPGKFKVKNEVSYDDIVVDNMFPQDVWLHPLATCVADSPWVYLRKRLDYASFLEKYSDNDMYENVHLVKQGQVFSGYDNGGETLWKNLADNTSTIVVMEKWNKMTDELTIKANGVEIYYGPSPYEDKEIPVTDYRNRLQFNTYLGESEMERIATICDALNAFINIAIDKEKRAGSGINLLDNNLSDFDDVGSLFSGTEAIRVENPRESFVHYDMPGMSASTDKMIQMLMDFLVYSTGIDFRQITDLSSSTKATVAALRREIAQQRINLNVNRNENCGIKRLGWLLAKRVQQFYTMPLVSKIMGEDMTEEDQKDQPTEYRQLRIPDMQMSEKMNSQGKYDSGSLRIKGKKDGAISFIPARPEYLRLKGDVSVKVIPGSTMGAIQELQKTKAKEYIDVATTVVKPSAQPGGMPEPYLSARYGLEQYVRAMGYDVDKAFDVADKGSETVAQDQGKQLIDSMSGIIGAPPIPGRQVQQGAAMATGPMPSTPPANPSLTGVKSDAMKEMANSMGTSNRVTNKPQ